MMHTTRHHLALGGGANSHNSSTSSCSSTATSALARPGSGQRASAGSRRHSGRRAGPLPLPRFGKPFSQQQTDSDRVVDRDVSTNAHCAIPWEIAEKSLVDPAGKDACGVGRFCASGACHVGLVMDDGHQKQKICAQTQRSAASTGAMALICIRHASQVISGGTDGQSSHNSNS